MEEQNNPPTPREEETRVAEKIRRKEFWKGFGLVMAIHPFQLLFPPIVIIVGVTQWVYVLPLLLIFGKGEQAMRQGIWTAAGVTFLLNTACFGGVMSGIIPARWF